MPDGAKKLDRAGARLPSSPKAPVNQFLTGPMTGEAIDAAGIAVKQALIGASPNGPTIWVTRRVPRGRRPRPTSATASPPGWC